jgi:exodeoxyribonuclease VII small subunit
LKLRESGYNVIPGLEPTGTTDFAVPSFEEALGQLETLVESMESGEVPLADLVAKFEQGNRLLRQCEGRLKEAELKIELLKKQKDGSVILAPMTAERDLT